MSIFISDHEFVNRCDPCEFRPKLSLSFLRKQEPKAISADDEGSRLPACPCRRPRHVGPRFRGGDAENYFTSPVPANSALVSWPPRKTKSPPINGSTASTKRPVEVEPVVSLTQPIRYGPPNPARLPIELIRAIAPAAAV